MGNPHQHFHDDAERDYSPKYLDQAYGDLKDFQKRGFRNRYFWPVQVLSIGHTNASYQNYSFGPSSAYFHHGIDIRADAGSDVIASAGGKVINIENYMPGNDAYWEVAILDDEGFIWQYHHIERQSIPDSIFEAYQKQIKIPAGTKLGEVYFWGVVTFGERFHHVHLNILGKNKAFLNPLAFLELLPDRSKPEISDIFLVKNGSKLSGTEVKGAGYSIGVEVKDLILSDVFTVPPHEIRISIDGQSPIQVWSFDELPGGGDEEAYVNQFYVARLVCGNYSCRKPIINLGFQKQANPSGVFPASVGKHTVDVWARDFNGNEAHRSWDWIVSY